jgi:hypothetical protein
MTGHVRILGWLQVALGVVDLLLALLVFGAFLGLGAAFGAAGEPALFGLGGLVGTVAGLLLALTGVPNLLAGLGLLAWKGWARVLALVLAVLNVLKFPWGTALAVYTWVVLTDDGVQAAFRRGHA